MSNTLLPCPFCGGEADVEEIPGSPFTNEPYMWAVGCEECNIGWYKETKEEAIAAWNRRVEPKRGEWKKGSEFQNNKNFKREDGGQAMKLIYVAHPFSGKQENVEKAERILRQLMREYPDYVFYSPLHATGYYYHDIPYEKGIEHCLEMLRRCDELWLCDGWEDSRGCSIEYSFANGMGMPIQEI